MMIQEISPAVFHNEFSLRPVTAADVVLVFFGNQILCRMDEHREIAYPVFDQLGVEKEQVTYLFAIDERVYYLLREWDGRPVDGYTYLSVEALRRVQPQTEAYAGLTAYHLSCWYRDNQYCGHCGKPLVEDEKERMLRCPMCQNMIYPRINPVIIVGVIRRDKILMTKYKGRTYKDYALVAGFTEFGETIEQTVAREVQEEVGLKVKNIRFYKSQPWGLSSSVLMGFFADVDGDTTIELEEEELAYGGWFRRDEINLPPDGVSLTREMILAFVHGEV